MDITKFKQMSDDDLLQEFMIWFRIAKNESKMSNELKEIIAEMKCRNMTDILKSLNS